MSGGDDGRDRPRVIAIDGPAGSGKSTVARAVAERVGLAHLDTGAMYRAVALAVLARGVDPADEEKVADVARSVTIAVGDRVVLDGQDVTGAIREAAVTDVVSEVAAHPAVRRVLVDRQRAWVEEHGGGVVEGRDIGTVVFPDAGAKVFLTASEEERSRRRSAEIAGSEPSSVAGDLARRDRYDSSRPHSPLAAAADAHVIDTTGRSVDEVVEEVLSRL